MEKDTKWMQKMLDYASDVASGKRETDLKSLYKAYDGVKKDAIESDYKKLYGDIPSKHEEYNELHVNNMKQLALQIPDLSFNERECILSAKSVREIYVAMGWVNN